MKTNLSVDCCNEHGMRHSPRNTHPSCAPVTIPKDDRFYSPLRRTCMNYVRSVPAMRTDCTFGPREQVSITQYCLSVFNCKRINNYTRTPVVSTEICSGMGMWDKSGYNDKQKNIVFFLKPTENFLKIRHYCACVSSSIRENTHT